MVLKSIQLKEIAYARSGDKGAHANIGVIAYTEEGYQFLKSHLLENNVQSYFKAIGAKEVIRYELPNLWALNFVLKNILGEGASTSLRIDPQGKVLGQALLELEMMISEEEFKLAYKGLSCTY